MNCKPGQFARIVRCAYGTDEEQLLGREVTVLVQTEIGRKAGWLIDPPLVLVATGDGRVGTQYFSHGDKVKVRVIPDEYLQPVEERDVEKVDDAAWRAGVESTDEMVEITGPGTGVEP